MGVSWNLRGSCGLGPCDSTIRTLPETAIAIAVGSKGRLEIKGSGSNWVGDQLVLGENVDPVAHLNRQESIACVRRAFGILRRAGDAVKGLSLCPGCAA